MQRGARRAGMNDVFTTGYADAYDLLYRDKDYNSECDLIERIFKTYGQSSVRRVLDLGCGTGGHAIPLAQRGYDVVGVDRSEPMLTHAKRKSRAASLSGGLTFRRADVRSISLDRQFDAALMMFDVLGYQLPNEGVVSTLRAARRHLASGALLIFDVWYGPAVLLQRPSLRTKTISIAGGEIRRTAFGELDTGRHVCTVRFHVRRLRAGLPDVEIREDHAVRYFFPLELKFFLECSGFTLIRLGAFPELDLEPDETTWHILGIARAA